MTSITDALKAVSGILFIGVVLYPFAHVAAALTGLSTAQVGILVATVTAIIILRGADR